MTDKRNIKALIEKEAPNLNNLLDPEEVKIFKGLTEELRDTWTKKQMFRTETEMQFSVLNDAKYPTKACASASVFLIPFLSANQHAPLSLAPIAQTST